MELGQSTVEDMVMDKKFWKDKKVLITGHTGFKGSWLSLWLQNMDARVIGYSLPPPTEPSMFKAANISAGMISMIGDVRDRDHLAAVISEFKPEIIIHLAAQSLVRYSYANPVETYATNVMGTVNLLEAARQSECAKIIVVVTSDKCYENKEWVWGYRENDPIGGRDPYSSSKGCAELVTAAYRDSFFPKEDYERHGIAVASVRAGNVIGGGDWSEDRLIPDIVRAFISDRPVIIRKPNSIRPWQYVLEPLHGYLCLIERLWEKGSEFGGGWNFGPDEGGVKPVSWIVERMTSLWGGNARWEPDKTDQHPHEANFLKLDCSKAQNKLSWKPRLDLTEAIAWTVEWYRNFYLDKDVRNYTEREISRYEKYRTEVISTLQGV